MQSGTPRSFSVDYWKEWKKTCSIQPPDDGPRLRRERALREKQAQRKTELNARSYLFMHPNKGWIPATGAKDEPESMLSQILGAEKVPLGWRPKSDMPKISDWIEPAAFRPRREGGPRRAKTSTFSKAARNKNSSDAASNKRDDPGYLPAKSTLGKCAVSHMRSAPNISFGSGPQRETAKVESSAGPRQLQTTLRKLGSVFGTSSRGDLKFSRDETPGPGSLPPDSGVRPKVRGPILGRTARWNNRSTAQTVGPEAVLLPTTVGNLSGRFRSRAASMGKDLETRMEDARGTIRTGTEDSDMDPTLEPMVNFGFGCSMEEHIKYGCCLDGKCAERSTWEKTNKMRLEGASLRKMRRRRFATQGLRLARSTGSRRTPRTTGSRRSARSMGTRSSRRTSVTAGSASTAGESTTSSMLSKRQHASAVWGETPVHLATRSGEPDKLVRLLHGVMVWDASQGRSVRRGRDINCRDSQNRTPLHTACEQGAVPMVRVLLDADPPAFLDAQDVHGNTPLHLAVANGHDYVAKMLIAAGADPDFQNQDGDMPYNLSTSHAAYQYVREASMLYDLRNKIAETKMDIARKHEARDLKYMRKLEVEALERQRLHVTGSSQYASIVKQLQNAAAGKRKLFGNVIGDISELFDRIDVNGDGHISRAEFERALARLDLGLTHEQIADMMQMADTDGNSTIERSEFFAALHQFAAL